MKKIILMLTLFLNLSVFAQDLNQIEKKLFDLNEKRLDWFDKTKNIVNNNWSAYDSLEVSNINIKNYVLEFSSKNKKTLKHPFSSIKKGFDILSSADGLFRIYSWNELSDGTMQFYKNVYQYSADGKVFSKLNEIDSKDPKDPSFSYFDINQVDVTGKKYYITSRVVIGSTANFYYEAKVFSIENGKLNENAKLIKTKTGLKNTLGYEVDLSTKSNRERNDRLQSGDFMRLIYDKNTNTIILPLINADGKVTKNKIKYQFTGQYFEKR